MREERDEGTALHSNVLIKQSDSLSPAFKHRDLSSRKGTVRSKKLKYVVMSRGDYESLVNRITALEERAGIRKQPQVVQSVSESSKTVAAWANEVFNVENTTCAIVEMEDGPCMIVNVRVDLHSSPEDISRKKSELHRKYVSISPTELPMRVKVIYGRSHHSI